MSNTFPGRCWAEVNLVALQKNVEAIRRRLPSNTRYISVVKADSYGLGAKRPVAALRAAGVDFFGVANVAEGAEIRPVAGECPILLLSATLPEEDDYLFEYNLTPTVSTVDEVRRYQEAARRRGARLPVHLKFDTGMGRLGIWHAEADKLLNAASKAALLRIRGLYSHFASAGEDAAFTRLQRERFLQVLGQFRSEDPSLLVHMDNSAGLASLPPDGPFNAVRVGLLQFGVLPAPESPLAEVGVTEVCSLHSRISVVKDLPAGTGISYGGTRKLDRDSRVAVMTAGYADGIQRACSNRAHLLVRERRCPILGNVTMDEIMVDVTDLPDVCCGDRATVFGRQEQAEIPLHEYSSWCGTIPWESLCAIGKRVARVYT